MPRQNGVGEGQCCGSAAAGIGCLHCCAANVQAKVRRTTGGVHRHRFAEGGRGSHCVASVQVIALRPCGRGEGHAADCGYHAVNRDAERTADSIGIACHVIKLATGHADHRGAAAQGVAQRQRGGVDLAVGGVHSQSAHRAVGHRDV